MYGCPVFIIINHSWGVNSNQDARSKVPHSPVSGDIMEVRKDLLIWKGIIHNVT